MPMSDAQLRQQLSDIEPSNRTYEGVGPSEVPQLVDLLDDEEEWLAARAVHALSRIDTEAARQAIADAAASPRIAVRIAAATSAGILPAGPSNEVLTRLLDDPNPAVRKFAIKSTSDRNNADVRRRLVEISTDDTDARLKRLAQQRNESIADS